ncbi:MAG: TolC family protein [Planctomycetota bacterium]
MYSPQSAARGPRTILALPAALLFAAACATYAPRPLDPARTAAEFRARRLDDPALVAFAKEVLPAGADFPPTAWDPTHLTLVALHENRELAAARARHAAALAGVELADVPPNPTLGLDSEYTANTGVLPWALGFTFELPIETGGKRAARVEVARREAELARVDVEAAAWNVRSNVRTAFVRFAAAMGEDALARAELALHARRCALLEARVQAGEEERGALVRAEAARARAAAERTTIAGRIATARTELARACDLPASALDGIELAWPGFDAPPRADGLDVEAERALVNRAELRRGLAEYAVAEARLQLEVARQYPDLALGPGFQWDRGDHKWRLALSVPLPLFDTHATAITEADAARTARAAEFEALETRVLGDVELARQALARAWDELEAARAAEATLTRVVENERVARDAGALDALAGIDAELERAHARRDAWNALVGVQSALGSLSDALATPLERSPTDAASKESPGRNP